MRLAYFLPFWPYLYTPWLFREIAWMQSRGHHLVVVSLGDPPGPKADLRLFGIQHIPVLQVPYLLPNDVVLFAGLLSALTGGATPLSLQKHIQNSGVRHGILTWSRLRRVTSFLSRHRIQVVEAHWASQGAELARQVQEILNIPYAVRLHGGDVHSNPSPRLPFMLQKASAICPVSHWLLHLLQGQITRSDLPSIPPLDISPDRVRICPNAIPLQIVSQSSAVQSDEVQRLCSIGRLDFEKRHVDIVETVARLAPQFSGLRLRIIGGGHLETSLRQQAQQMGIADRLEITGPQPWEEVIRLAQQSHIYIQASSVEGFSLATLEGISHGVPLIVTRTGAYEQFVDQGINGWCYEAGDIDSLESYLRELLLVGPVKRQIMGDKTLEIIRKYFVFEVNMPRVEAILAAVANRSFLPE